MKRIAKLSNGVVRLLVKESDDYVLDHNEADVTGLHVGPGFVFDGETYSDPKAEQFDTDLTASNGSVLPDDLPHKRERDSRTSDAYTADLLKPKKKKETKKKKRKPAKP